MKSITQIVKEIVTEYDVLLDAYKQERENLESAIKHLDSI